MRTNGIAWTVAVLTAGALVVGCTTTQTHTAAGTGIGAGVGAIVGHNLGDGSGDRDKGALIGGAIGGVLGHQMGKQKEAQQQTDQRLRELESQAQTREVWITNPNGSRTRVELKAGEGGTWIGPRGEVYNEFPTAEQLQQVYGVK